MQMSESLDEISNLVLELDNNLNTPEDYLSAREPFLINNDIPDVCHISNTNKQTMLGTETVIPGEALTIDFNRLLGRGTFSNVYAATVFESKAAVNAFKTEIVHAKDVRSRTTGIMVFIFWQ